MGILSQNSLVSRHDRVSDLLVVGIVGVIGSIASFDCSRISRSSTATGRHGAGIARGSAIASGRDNGGVTVGGCGSSVGASGDGAGGIVTINRHCGRIRRATIASGRCVCIAADGHIARNHAVNRRNNCIARSEITVNRCGVNTARCRGIGTDRRPLPGLGVSEIILSCSKANRYNRRLTCGIVAHSSSLGPGRRRCGHT